MNLTAAITHLAAYNRPFVCYRLPHNEEPVLLSGGNFSKPDFHDETINGFLFVPFDLDSKCLPFIYNGGTQVAGWDFQHDGQDFNSPNSIPCSPSPEYPCTGKTDYLKQAESLHKKLLTGELQKVVLSRVHCTSLPQNFELGSFFEKLCRKYASAFVYIVYFDKANYWVGASPEVLLQVENGEGMTMSLAGTVLVKDQSAETDWTQKELNENNFVLQYIIQKLHQAGISEISTTSLQTVLAGPVQHLRKLLKFSLPSGVNPLKLALNLHPTPAVCGIPSDAALRSIQQTEPHSRNYYSGFLGPVSHAANIHLFVNLRCMHVNDRMAFIFVGGGLMPQSEIEKEWEETQAKAETLLSVIKEYNNNV